GFGVFYDVLKGEDNLQFNGQGPFFGAAFIGFDPPKTITATVPYLTDPFGSSGTPQSFPSRPPASNIDFDKAGFLPFGGSSVYFVDPHLRTPYTYQYNLSLQHEFGAGLVSEVSYVGSSSHKLTSLVDNNPFIRGTSTRSANAQPGVRAGSFGLLDTFENVGNASYNSLQSSLQKRTADVRFFGTTYFTLAYTYSHNIDSVSGFRENTSKVPYYNHKLFHGNADTDLRHNVSFSGGWDLPFDHWWSSGPKRLIGGWSLYPIVTWRTGFPLDVYAGFGESSTRTGPSGAGDRDIVHADLVGSKITTFDPKNPRAINGTSGHYYFDPGNFSAARFTSAFEAAVIANPSLATYGTLPRNSFFGPGRTNFDLSLSKRIPIYRERVAAELRGDFFNILNHAEFDIPSRTITSGQFGQVSTTADPRIIQLAIRLTF
ncbi:MAG: hypothetical protein M3Z36_13505, partial [Acidobacteriota bacterium]|nr:hypothetical protein [Acidobacteriota bacterium]